MPLEALLETLRPILSLLSRFVDEGTQIAQQWFESQDVPRDPWLFSHMVRFHICRRLDEHSGDESIAFRRIPYALSGVEVSYRGKNLKVFKSSDGELPAAGPSWARREFYNGNLFADSDVDFFSTSNLVLLWEMENGMPQFQLVCPRDGEEFWKSGRQLWAKNVPYPWIVPTTATLNDSASEVTGFGGDDAAEDLDMDLKEGEGLEEE